MWWSLFKLLKYIRKHTWYNSSFCPFFPSTHRKSLPTARLAIRKNSAIIAIKAVQLLRIFAIEWFSTQKPAWNRTHDDLLYSTFCTWTNPRLSFVQRWLNKGIYWICMVILLFVWWCWFDPCEYFQLLFYHLLFECS